MEAYATSELLVNSLNPQQRKAAELVDHHVRIVAGAGSGKTRVIISRIEYLIRQCRVFPSRILAITFTNKAANEMKERLEKQIGPDAQDVRISTIHSLCARILREDGDLLGYPHNFTILDGDDQRSLVLRYMKDNGIEKKSVQPGTILSLISKWKMKGLSAQEVAKENPYGNKAVSLAMEFYPYYLNALWEMRAMDFDDLLINTEKLLRENRLVREKWQGRLDYLHVDEFQDVDLLQYKIIRLLTSKEAFLCVVGDPDQTIYTWRGADVDIFLHFDEDFKDCYTILLTQNYRSCSSILDAANAVIQHNSARIKKDLYTDNESGEAINVHQSFDDDEEAQYVVNKILDQHYKEHQPYSDTAILYRANFSSRAFEKELQARHVPYRIYGGLRFYDRKEIKDILSYLRLVMDPKGDKAFLKSLDMPLLRIINEPKRAIGPGTIEKLQNEAAQRDLSLMEVLADMQSITGAPKKKLQKFHEMIEGFKEASKTISVISLIDLILKESGYLQMLEDKREVERIDNINELKKDFSDDQMLDCQQVLENYFTEVALSSERAEGEVENAVNLMTVHAAKGTEFDNVFLVSFNDGIFPSSRALNSYQSKKSLEEERRLFYVAMTRAKKRLTITFNTGFSPVSQCSKSPSSFLLEVPKGYVKSNLKKTSRFEEDLFDNDLFEEDDFEIKPDLADITSPLKAKKSSRAKNRRRKGRVEQFLPGDLVRHEEFGEGVVISQVEDTLTVAFSHEIGTKMMKAWSIKRID